MQIREILTEIVWEEQYASMKAAKKYPRDWIHFSNVPKLGINPSKTHRDPPGIYFYPIPWLLAYEASPSQYGTSMPYYAICRFSPTPNSVVLSRATTRSTRTVAQRNGWIDDFDRVVRDGKLQTVNNPMDPKLLRRPGGLFYAAMDYLVNIEGRKWLELLRGVDALFDFGGGIISANEVQQAVIINRRIMTVLEQGSNKDEWNQVHAKMMQDLATAYNGKFYYKNKVPIIDVNIDGKPIRMMFDSGNWRIFLEYNRNGYWVRKQERYESSSYGDYENVLGMLRYYLLAAAKDATPEAVTRYWNKDRVLQLIQALFRGGNFNAHATPEGGTRYSVIWDSSLYSALYLLVHPDDSLEVNAWVAMSHQAKGEVQTTFPAGTTVEQIVPAILTPMTQQVRQAFPNADWAKLVELVRFKLPAG
jgi:hypothetical protein